MATCLLAASAVGCAAAAPAGDPQIKITDAQAAEVGQKIWQNESGGKFLVWWDDVCQCSSMGINNYLWYAEGQAHSFDAPFLDLLDFLERSGAPPPVWLKGHPASPWKDRAAFEKDADAPRMSELREYMRATVGLQARYSANRLEAALPKMLAAALRKDRQNVRRQFYRVANSSGSYALVDYVNFKGEGVFPKERYRGEGWGLLQVLQGMRGEKEGPEALDEFVRSAEAVLARRIDNAPDEKKARDAKWLPVWIRRVRTYRAD